VFLPNKFKKMNFQELREVYKKSVLKFAEGWRVQLTDHQVDTMISVMLHRDGIQTGGSFVESIANNDLYGATSRADSENLQNLKYVTLCFKNNHIHPKPTLD
jgi:hypothetical protein